MLLAFWDLDVFLALFGLVLSSILCSPGVLLLFWLWCCGVFMWASWVGGGLGFGIWDSGGLGCF